MFILRVSVRIVCLQQSPFIKARRNDATFKRLPHTQRFALSAGNRDVSLKKDKGREFHEEVLAL